MTLSDVSPLPGCIEITDVRCLVGKCFGLRFAVSLLVGTGDDQTRLDNVVVRAGSHGEREAWVETCDPLSMMRFPDPLAEVIVQLTLAHAGSTILFASRESRVAR